MKKALVLSLVLIAFTANLNAFTDAEIHQEALDLLKAVNTDQVRSDYNLKDINGRVCKWIIFVDPMDFEEGGEESTLIVARGKYGISIIDLVRNALQQDPSLLGKASSQDSLRLYANWAPQCEHHALG